MGTDKARGIDRVEGEGGGSMKERLLAKLANRQACIGVVGLGYVGLPLALEFGKAGFRVIGYDVSKSVVDGLMRGESHIKDIPSSEVAALVAAGLTVGEDVFLAFSPERVDPGNPTWTTKNTPKVVGGITPACTELASALYASCLETIVPVSSTETAEIVKLLENTFRSVNIGLVNEMQIVCDKLGVNIWEVIEAAATKPFGFMKFTPGPGIGGHCIPLDPHYLAWKMRTLNYRTRFIELAGEINAE